MLPVTSTLHTGCYIASGIAGLFFFFSASGCCCCSRCVFVSINVFCIPMPHCSSEFKFWESLRVWTVHSLKLKTASWWCFQQLWLSYSVFWVKVRDFVFLSKLLWLQLVYFMLLSCLYFRVICQQFSDSAWESQVCHSGKYCDHQCHRKYKYW